MFYFAESNDGPSNQVAYRGDPVFIECKDERDSNECLTWRFHAVTADNPKTIVFNSSIVATSFTRVTMIARNEDNKKDDLLIPRAGAEDAGTYYCMGGKQYTAELIIFGELCVDKIPTHSEMAPEFLSHHTSYHSVTYTYLLTNSILTYYVNPPTTFAYPQSFSSTASRVWNKLPTHVSSALILPVFRRHLKHHYFLDAYPGFTAPIKIEGTMPST